jgi:uncharacterized membrane protein YqaE (UPF0057 family)
MAGVDTSSRDDRQRPGTGLIVGVFVLVTVVAIVAAIFVSKPPIVGLVFYPVAFNMVAGFYLLPSIVAIWMQRRQWFAITMLNMLLGWTLLGWVAALVWAVIEDRA